MSAPERMPNRAIELEELRATSEALWGNAVYGDVAERWLRAHMQSASYGKVTTRSGNRLIVSMSGRFDTQEVPAKERILGAARQLMPLSPYIMGVGAVDERSFYYFESERPKYLIRPSGVGLHPLIRYVRGHQYDRHIFHGSYGKALDTLSVVSGVVAPEALDTSKYEEPFIHFTDLCAELVAGIPEEWRWQQTLQKIRTFVHTQPMNGVVDDGGEIVFEGAVDPFARPSTYEQVAYASLLTIAGRCKPGNVVGDFLRERFSV